MGATIYAVPTLIITTSRLILGQVPRWLAAAGGALCLTGSPYRGRAWLVRLEPATGGL
jgi:hypothetical protein